MKYHIIDAKDHLLIKLSGNTRMNEPLLVRRMLSPYLTKKGVRVIIDLKELMRFDPATLVSVLNSIKKEVDLVNGELKLRSLKPDVAFHLKENHLDRVFKLAEEEVDTDEYAKRTEDER